MSASPAGPPAEVIVAVDVGTTAAKVVAFGLGSSWRHLAVREYPLLAPEPGFQVQDPDTVVAAALAALDDCVRHASGARIVGISVSTAMHGLIGLDSDLRPLTPLVTWADARARDEARALRGSGQADELRRRSGTPVHPMSPLTKLIWFARHEPELCRRVRWWVGLKDYVLHALTGILATELSSASGTGLLDLATRQWSSAALDLAGVTAAQLPPVLATTAVLGLSRSTAARLGLPTTTPVVVGAGDGPLGNLGSGALLPGVVGLSIGTSGAARMVVPGPVADPGARLFCYALTDEAWVVGGAVSNGGAVARWAGGVFGDQRPSGDADAALLELAAPVPAGSDGMVMLPYLLAERGPLWDPDLTGAFLGVTHRHTRGHFVRAAVEGVALQLSTIVDALDAVHPVTAVRATGGVFRSALWRSVVAGVLDRPVRVTAGAEGSALGAAALGLLALGRAVDLAGAVAAVSPGVDDGQSISVPASDVVAYRQLRRTVPQLLASYGEVARLFDTSTVDRERPPP